MLFSLLKSTIQDYTNENNLYPLVAFTLFLTHKQRCILALIRWNDLTLQQLHLIAKQTIEEIEKEQDKRIAVLQTICEVNEKQYKKIQDYLKDEPSKISKALQYTKNDREYSARLKRKYGDIASANEVSKESITLMEEPPTITKVHKTSNFEISVMKFVEEYVSYNVGKANWNRCFEEGLKQRRINRYASSNSLRVTYNKYKKQNKYG